MPIIPKFSHPVPGQMFDLNGNVLNIHESYDRFMHLKTAEYTPIIEIKPYPALSFIRNRTVPVNAPEVTLVGGENKIDGTLQKIELYTRDVGRYLPGLYGLAGIGVRFENIASGTYEFGYGDDIGNRIGIRSINGELYTVLISGGVEKVVRPRSQWLDPLDGSGPSGIKLSNISKLVFRAQIGWYGYLSIEYKLVIASRNKGDQLITIDTEGLDDENAISIEQPDLPIYAEADGGIIYVGGRQYGVYGRYNPEYRITATQAVSKSIPDTGFVPIMSLKIKESGEWDAVPIIFSKLVAEVDLSCEYRLVLHDEGDLRLTGSNFGLNDIDGIPPSETALEIDTSATAIDLTTAPDRLYKMYGDIFSGGTGRSAKTDDEDAPDIRIPKGLIISLIAVSDAGSASTKSMLKFKEEW